MSVFAKKFDKVIILTLETSDLDRLLQYYQNFFDKDDIYFMTVKNENDGLASANEGNLDTSLWDILCHRTVDNISRAILKNHISMIQYAYNQNYNTVLFLEDDARFPAPEKMSKNMINAIDSMIHHTNHIEWDILYLGHCPWPILFSYPVSRHVVKVFTPLTSHSYILQKNGMKKIFEFFHDNIESVQHLHIDKLFCRIKNLKKYAMFPSICFQEKDPALFTKAMDFCGLSIQFVFFSRMMEMIAIIMPFLIMVAVLLFFYFTLKS